MIICIAGKNNIAVDVMEYLVNYLRIIDRTDIKIVSVYNKNETGKNLWQKSFKFYCDRQNIQSCKLQDLYDKKDLIFLSLEYDKIINPGNFVSDKLFNIHFSLLPKYKGCFTSVWPLLNDEKETGVTFHYIDFGIDTGKIVAQKKIPIEEDDTAFSLYQKYIDAGTEIVKYYIPLLINGRVPVGTKQTAKLSSYYSSNTLFFDSLHVNCCQTAYQIRNQIRAFSFRPYQFMTFKNYNIHSCKITDEISECKPGEILYSDKYGFEISTIDYNVFLYIDQLQYLLKQIERGNNVIAKEIIENNRAYINEKDNNGRDPLIVAVYYNNLEMAQYLFKYGANIDTIDYDGRNLLMYAKDCYVETGETQMFELILRMGIDSKKKDYNGISLVEECCLNGIYRIGKYIMSEK